MLDVGAIALPLEFGFTRAVGIGTVGADRSVGVARIQEQGQFGIHRRCDRREVDVPGQQRQRIVQALALGIALFAGENRLIIGGSRAGGFRSL